MHYLYTPISINGAPFIAKVSIEEYDLTGKNRAYNLQRIELSKVSRAQYSQLIEENREKYAYTFDALSVAQLFDFVKQNDKNFNPKPVNEALIENGKPKVFYHGAKKNGGFTEFRSWQYFTDNKGYAEDGKGKYESNFPKGTPKAAKAEKILQYIQNVWSKKPIRLKITENGETRYIEAKFDPTYDESGNTPTDASKLMGGNRHGTSSEQRVTLDLADDYYKIASESQYNYSKDETGKDNPAHKDVVKWHYFINDIYFAEYGSNDYAPYRVSINVKERADGDFVYSFSAEKQRELNTPRTLHAVVNDGENSNANVQLSDNRVAQNKPSVNSNSMQETRELLKYYFCFVCLVCYPSKTECNHTAGVDVILSKKGM